MQALALTCIAQGMRLYDAGPDILNVDLSYRVASHANQQDFPFSRC